MTDPKDNPKDNPTKASKATPALAAAVATVVDAGTPQNTAAAPAADEHQGVGGLYEMVDGKRQLVARTQIA